MSEKYILLRKELHLGHVRETFRAGAVIELDEDNGRIIIDGRKFNDTRDLEVLKRQAIKFPEDPWIMPYTKEAHVVVLESVREKELAKNPRPASAIRKDQQLKVIQSDSDLIEPIDIRDTKVSNNNAAARQDAKDAVKENGMEIIRGDETVEERLAGLKGKTDPSSIAERVRLKMTGSVKMAVVQDDSLGAGFGQKMSMNAGQHLPSREEVEAKTETKKAEAEARKLEADRKRQVAGIVVPSEPSEDMPVATVVESGSIKTMTPKAAADVSGVAEKSATPRDELAELRAENAKLKADKASTEDRLGGIEKMLAQMAAAPQKRPMGRPRATGTSPAVAKAAVDAVVTSSVQ